MAILIVWGGSDVRAADKIRSLSIDSKIVIDGKIDDWSNLDVHYHNDEGTVLGICHDQSNLYLQLRFREPLQAAMIRRHNLTIWLDNQGKKEKYYRLRYNNGLSPDQMNSGMKQPGRPGRQDQKTAEMPGAEKPDAIELQAYREGWRSPRSYALDGADPVAAAFDTSFSFFVYEFRIPLGDSLSAPDGIELGKKGKVGIGLEYSQLKNQPRLGHRDPSFVDPQGIGGGRGGGRGGMGGKSGGGMPQGMRGKGDMEPERIEEWFKTEIVLSKAE
ncbi:MAG: hypothetical protein P1R58_10320 [bacterium]|nr:hypothetical protein [bacterium]